MIDFKRIPEGPLAVFGPTWDSLSEFDQIVLEAVTESDSDFSALLAAMEQNAETDQQGLVFLRYLWEDLAPLRRTA